MRCFKLLRKTLWVCLLIGELGAVSFAQNGSRLHLVTGLPSRSVGFDLKVGSSVFAVDELRRTAVKVADLLDAREGGMFVLADHDRRILAAVANPDGNSTKLTILDMDSPGAPRTFHVSLPAPHLSTAFLLQPLGKNVILALSGFDLQSQRSYLMGVDLALSRESSVVQPTLSWGDYRSVRLEGWWNPGDPFQRFDMSWQDGKMVTQRGDERIFMDVPSLASFQAAGDQPFLLDTNNDHLLVVDWQKERGTGSSGVQGVTRLSIYEKKNQKWQTETFAGGSSSVRSYGAWVAVSQAASKVDLSKDAVVRGPDEKQSLGQAIRSTVVNPKDPPEKQVPAEAIFRDSPAYYSGTVFLFDSRSNRKYQLETGEGDTEVLLIEGTTLYYRVNDALFRAQLGATGIQDATEILRDNNVALTHWAFLAP